MCSIQQKQTLCKQIKWCRNPLHKMIGEASMLTLYASQVFMSFDGWPPTPDIFIIFQHVGRRLHWSDDSYKKANKEYGHSGNRWPFICTGKVNLVYHQSVLCSRSVMFWEVWWQIKQRKHSSIDYDIFCRPNLSNCSIVYAWFRSVRSYSIDSGFTLLTPNYRFCVMSKTDECMLQSMEPWDHYQPHDGEYLVILQKVILERR